MSRRAIEAQLRRLVRRVAPGAMIYFPRKRTPPLGHSWNGRHLRPTGLTLESQLHEVAHLLVAAPERRALPEFGLGPDPYRRGPVARTVTDEQAAREELDACRLQMLLATVFDLDVGAVTAEFSQPSLTAADVGELRDRYADALPSDVWERAHLRLAGARGM